MKEKLQENLQNIPICYKFEYIDRPYQNFFQKFKSSKEAKIFALKIEEDIKCTIKISST